MTIKIFRKPPVALICKPVIDWTAFRKFIYDNYDLDLMPFGMTLDNEGATHAFYSGDMLPMIAGKGCYKSWAVGKKNPREYLANIIEQEHGSVLEHANFTFSLITTRAISHEIVRHRAGFAFSQESQRFCDEKDNAFMMPLSIQGDALCEQAWTDTMEMAMNNYVHLTELLVKRYEKDERFKDLSKTDMRKKIREASRGALPNDTATYMTMTGNIRAWRHFLEMRSSRHAEAGIRMLADEIYNKLVVECPILFSDYKKVELPDGTFELVTEHRKV